jgi:hypothetical protein
LSSSLNLIQNQPIVRDRLQFIGGLLINNGHHTSTNASNLINNNSFHFNNNNNNHNNNTSSSSLTLNNNHLSADTISSVVSSVASGQNLLANNNSYTSINNNNNDKNNMTHSADNNLNNSLDVLQNTYTFSNSSSWTGQGNDDELEDFDSDINIKSLTFRNGKHNSSSASFGRQKRQLNKEQAQFNKFVREEVAKKFGENFLLQHEVNQLQSSIMEIIKNEAIATLLPKNTTSKRAWTLAKVSLRSLKRDLTRKQQGITTYTNNTSTNNNNNSSKRN